MLGEIHWHILRASQLMYEKTIVKRGKARGGDAFPKPGSDIRKIIEFKRKRSHELLRFRSSIDDLEDKLAKPRDKEEVRHNLIRCAEK